MRKFAGLLLFFAGTMAGSGYAQNWIVFVPAERDFRVLFPSPPDRFTAGDGSIAFKTSVEHDGYNANYVVYRLPANVRYIDDARAEIQKRIVERVGDDRGVRYANEDDGDSGWERHVFRYGPIVSIHRLVGHRGRYYELEVSGPRGVAPLAMNTARDFFNSFHMSGVTLPGLGIAVGQRLEAWCQNRTDPFSHAFCRYSVCLREDHGQYPHCAALYRR